MKLKRRKIKRGRIEIIPMIDTIVILLIFYLSFATFVDTSNRAAMRLPVARAGDPAAVLPSQVIVNMESADRIYVGDQVVTAATLPTALKQLKAQNPSINSVILRGNQAMTYADLSAYLLACAQAGITDHSFRVQGDQFLP